MVRMRAIVRERVDRREYMNIKQGTRRKQDSEDERTCMFLGASLWSRKPLLALLKRTE